MRARFQVRAWVTASFFAAAAFSSWPASGASPGSSGAIQQASELAPEVVDEALLDAARSAARRGDQTLALRALGGWATLRPRRRLPTGLESLADEALRLAANNGYFRAYASRVEGRLRVGLHDPAGLVDRVEAWIEGVDGVPARLERSEGERAGRFEFLLEADRRASRPISILLFSDGLGLRAPVARVELGSLAMEPPRAPVAKAAAARDEPKEPPSVRWWVVALGAVAAALAGWALVRDLEE